MATPEAPPKRTQQRSVHRSIVSNHRHEEGILSRASAAKLSASRRKEGNDGVELVAMSASSFSIVASAIVLWSECAILLTGCGPVNLSDGLERGSYLAVLVTSSLFWLTRIVARQGLSRVLLGEQVATMGSSASRQLLEWAERWNALAVLGAFVALGLQINRDTRMDGLTGINVEMCRAMREF